MWTEVERPDDPPSKREVKIGGQRRRILEDGEGRMRLTTVVIVALICRCDGCTSYIRQKTHQPPWNGQNTAIQRVTPFCPLYRRRLSPTRKGRPTARCPTGYFGWRESCNGETASSKENKHHITFLGAGVGINSHLPFSAYTSYSSLLI